MSKHKVNSQLLFVLLIVLGVIALPAAFVLVTSGDDTQQIKFQGSSQDGFTYTFYAKAPKELSQAHIDCVVGVANLYFSQHDLAPITRSTNELTHKNLTNLFDGLSQVVDRTCQDVAFFHSELNIKVN